jgi:hypothetical protein
VINSDPSPTFSGLWDLQNVPPGLKSFNQTSFNGNVALWANGLAQSGAAGDVVLATENADGVNSVSSQNYRDIAGAFQTTNTSCTYTVVANGRVALTGSNCGAAPPVLYLNALNSAFVIGADPNVEWGSFLPQSAGLSAVSMAGTYYLGTTEIVSQDDQAEVEILTLTSNGVVTTTSDTTSTLAQSVGAAGSDTLSVNPDGTFSTGSSGGAVAGIAISNNNFVMVTNPTLTFPTLLIAQQ